MKTWAQMSVAERKREYLTRDSAFFSARMFIAPPKRKKAKR